MSHIDVNGSPLPSTSSMASQYSHGIYLSAPGKIILFGEHAVVYGKTAIAGSIDLRTYLSLFTSQDGVIYLSLPDLNVEKTWMLKDLIRAAEKLAEQGTFVDDSTMPPSLEVIVPLARKLSGSCEETCGVQHLAVLAFWYLLLGVAQRKRDLSAVKVTVKFKLPSCVGLGSSGAYCVCMAAALLQATGLIPPPHNEASTDGEIVCTWDDAHLDMIRKWATAAESLIHGRASGIDAAVCTYGGIASFKPGAKIQHLKTCTKPDLKVILVNSKVERNTARMVATVKDKYRKYPDVIEPIFCAIDGISKEAITLLTRNESLGTSSLIDQHRPSITLNNATLTVGFNQSGSSSSDHGSIMAGDCNDDEHRSLQGSLLTPRGSTSGASPSKGCQHDGFAMLNDLCRINNQLLIALGVGHPKIDQISTLLARYGIHPKMTGAGGGGSVFAFLKPDTSPTVMSMIESELSKIGYELWRPSLGGVGVVQHHRRPEIFGSGSSTPIARSRTSSSRAGK